MKITTKEVRAVAAILDDIIDDYKEKTVAEKRDWRTYEQRVAARLRTAFRELKPLVEEAFFFIVSHKGGVTRCPLPSSRWNRRSWHFYSNTCWGRAIGT